MSHFEIVNDGVKDVDQQLNELFIQLTKNKQKNNMLQTILSISGKPGLYKLVSSGKASLIVEAIDETHKRMPCQP